MAKAFGIINSPANYINVEGLQKYRPIGAFSFAGKYRVIDFPLSNMSNSGIDRIVAYVRENPRSLTEHVRTAGNYNINSKRGHIQVLFAETNSASDIYNTDIAVFMENLSIIERMTIPYVIIVPSYMVFTQNFDDLLRQHIESRADITLLYHHTNEAKDYFLQSDFLKLNRQKGVEGIERNRGTAKDRDIFMDTYIMSRELFIELVKKAVSLSSIYTLCQIVAMSTRELDIRGVAHRGYFAALTDFKSYFTANLELLDPDAQNQLFSAQWPIYTDTSDFCPTHYFSGASAKNSLISNGCVIRGTVENSIVGRGAVIEEGAVIKNSLIMAHSHIGKGIHLEYQLIDKWADVLHVDEIIGTPDKLGYVRREDII
ncbi:MAG: glucose-1-phosphate adenylyltransferase subunit GlgD [Eubacterium sp.]|nr:glucose-1-phosphate adenylyltransferase subunit GlgD [Eubacterium sp.]